jgi:hypothetical protein
MGKRKFLPGAVLPAIFLLALLLAAAAAAAAAKPVAVDIGVVLASGKGSDFDPSLSSLRPKLKEMFPYTSYRLIDRMRKTLAVGETGDFLLPGGRLLRLTPMTAPESKVRLAMQVLEGEKNLLTTALGLSRGGMVLVGGPPHESGVLILVISAE